MRSVLPLAVCLTLIAGLMRLSLVFTPPAGANENATAGAVSILAASRGHMLPSATLPGGGESFSDVIAVGDLLLTPRDSAAGLRVALLGPRLDFQRHAVLPIPAGAEEFRALVDGAEAGSVLIAAVQGDVQASGAALAELDEILQHLGASASPFRLARNSWGLIAHKQGRAWRVLGEVYSRSREVHLALSLRLDLLLDGGPLQPFLEVEAEGPCRLALTETFDSRTSDSVGAYVNRWARIGGSREAALQLKGDGGRVAWSRVAWGSDARFACDLALGGQVSDRPITLELRLDGELVATTDTAGLSTGAPRPWQVALPSTLGQDVRLELRARQEKPVSGAYVLLGTPTLSWTSEAR